MKTPKSETPNYHTQYGSLSRDGILTDEVIDAQRKYYRDNHAGFAHELEESTRTLELGGTQFRAVVVRGEAPETIVIGGEYGNANSIQAYTRAMGIRAVLGPEASLVLLPNNTLGENNLQFSHSERQKIARGDDTPYTERYKTALAEVGSDDTQLHIVGMSLGATTGSALAAESDINLSSLTLVEPPYLSGSVLAIAAKFAQSGGQLPQNIEISKQGIPDFSSIELDSTLGFARFGIGSLSPSNLASLNFMKHHSTGYDLFLAKALHENTGLVVAYGTEAQISPVATNEAIAANYIHDPRTKFVEIPDADHSVTNAHAVVAALALRAKSLAS